MEFINGKQELGTPFPGSLGRPSTYHNEKAIESKIVHRQQKASIRVESVVKTVSPKKHNNVIKIETPKNEFLRKVIKKVERPQTILVDISDDNEDKEYDVSPILPSSGPKKTQQKNRKMKSSIASSPLSSKSLSQLASTKSQKDILSEYKEKINTERVNYELEAKLQKNSTGSIDSSTYQMLFDYYTSDDKTVQIIKTTEYANSEGIRKIVNQSGDQIFIKKTKLISYKPDNSIITLTLSSEEKLHSIPSGFKPTLERVKNRSRITVGPNEEYYLDLTQVKTTTANSIKESFEIELEHIIGRPYPSSADDMINYLKQIITDINKEKEFAIVRNLLHKNVGKIHSILTQVQTLSKPKYYEIFLNKIEEGFYVTNKPDGERILLVISDNTQYMFKAPRKLVNQEVTTINGSWIFDCELYNDQIQIIDVVYPIISGNILERLSQIPKELKSRIKPYKVVTSLQDLKVSIDELYTKSSINVDGLIFVTKGQLYTDTDVYKWKEKKHQTIDLGMYKNIEIKNKNGLYHYVLYAKMNRLEMELMGIHPVKSIPKSGHGVLYVDVQFTPAVSPYIYEYSSKDSDMAGKIYEMIPSNDLRSMIIVRHRKDKEYPNNHKTCESNFNMAFDTFSIRDFFEKESDYFEKSNMKDEFSNYRYMMRKLSSYFLYNGVSCCLDYGVGRDGDGPTRKRYGVKYVLGIEKDSAALDEACMRRYPNIHSDKLDIQRLKNETHTVFYGLNRDVTLLPTTPSDIDKLLKPYRLPAIDRIVSNFSAHHFMSSEEEMQDVLRGATNILIKGNSFVIVCLDDEKIQNLDISQIGKHHIETGVNNKIKVKVPFKNELQEELLLNKQLLKHVSETLGFSFMEKSLTSQIHNNKKSREEYDKLSKDDKYYINLHVVYILTKL